VAGSLLLLFGIRTTRLIRIEAKHLEDTETDKHLRVGEYALLLPPALARIALQHRNRDDLRSVFQR